VPLRVELRLAARLPEGCWHLAISFLQHKSEHLSSLGHSKRAVLQTRYFVALLQTRSSVHDGLYLNESTGRRGGWQAGEEGRNECRKGTQAKYQPVEMRGRLPLAAPKLPAQLRQPTKQTLARQVSDSERTDSPSQHNSACTQNRLAPLVPWHNIDTRVLDVCRYLRGKYGADCEATNFGTYSSICV